MSYLSRIANHLPIFEELYEARSKLGFHADGIKSEFRP